VDHLHTATGGHRRVPCAGAGVPERHPAQAGRARRALDPARRGGLCDQEVRHELLHDPRDLCPVWFPLPRSRAGSSASISTATVRAERPPARRRRISICSRTRCINTEICILVA
jgi:hypothetical protein